MRVYHPKEELEDFCDTHLVYLTDEGFSIDYGEIYGGHCTNITIRHSKRVFNYGQSIFY